MHDLGFSGEGVFTPHGLYLKHKQRFEKMSKGNYSWFQERASRVGDPESREGGWKASQASGWRGQHCRPSLEQASKLKGLRPGAAPVAASPGGIPQGGGHFLHVGHLSPSAAWILPEPGGPGLSL